VREYFGAHHGYDVRCSQHGRDLGHGEGPWAGGWLYDAMPAFLALYQLFGIGLGAVAMPSPTPRAGGTAEPQRRVMTQLKAGTRVACRGKVPRTSVMPTKLGEPPKRMRARPPGNKIGALRQTSGIWLGGINL
jgi:hypothetical protein